MLVAIENTPPTLPDTIEYDRVFPSSTSVAETVPTAVPTLASSRTDEKAYSLDPNTGAPLQYERPDTCASFMPTFRKPAGMHPTNLFPVSPASNNSTLPRRVIFSSSRGNSPVNRLRLRFNKLRFLRFPNSRGISPLNRFRRRISTVRCRKFPNSRGISPLNRLLLRISCDKLCKFPNSRGISPLN